MFYVIELQTNENGTALVNTFTNKNEALSRFYYILSFAANSEVTYHSCIVVDEIGRVIEGKYFMHQPQIQNEETVI